MAITHVKVSRSLAVGADLCEAINLIESGIALLNRTHATCDSARSAGASPPDDTVFEGGTLIGANTGEGSTFFAALNSLKIGLADTGITGNIAKLDQGSGNNLS